AEIIASFSLDDVSRHAAIYDVKKLTWLNGRYLNELPLERIVREAVPFLQARGYIKEDFDQETLRYIERVVDTVRTRVHTLAELAAAADYFFTSDFPYEEKGVKKYFARPGTAELLARGREAIARTEPFDLETVEAAYRELIAEMNISGGALIHPTRLALSGRTVGPGLFDIMATLGKSRCLERMDRAIRFLQSGAQANEGNGKNQEVFPREMK
ncbi:MAG: glutamate--tRNA ligase, partial [Desulfotomaculales bacterium]